MLENHKPPFRGLNGCAFVWIRLTLSGVFRTHQVAKAAWIVPHLDKHESLEQLNTAFSMHSSFRKTPHAISKHLILEDLNGGHYEYFNTDTAISDCANTGASSSEAPPYHNKIECASTAGGKTTRTSGFNLHNDLDKASQCALCSMKTSFFFLDYYNKNRPNKVLPLYKVKWYINLTSKRHHQACMVIWCKNSRKGLKKLNKRCATSHDKKQRVSREN